MANSPAIARLLDEFKAQDHGVQLVVLKGFDRVIAAKFSEGNQSWEPTQAGIDLLFPPEEEEKEEKEATLAEKQRAALKPRNISVKATLGK